MKKQHTSWFAAVAAGAFVLSASPAAHAVATLMISDGTTTKTIADGSVVAGSEDNVPLAGIVSYNSTVSGAIGGWVLNIDTGATYPAFGSVPTSPNLTLGFQNGYNGTNATGGPGTVLTLKFSEVGYLLSDSSFLATLGATQIQGGNDITVQYQAFDGLGNTLFQQSNQLGSTLSGSVASGSSTTSIQGGLPTPYSLTQVITFTYVGLGGGIANGGGALVSGSAALQGTAVPDGGATAALLGMSLLGLAIAGRSKLQTA